MPGIMRTCNTFSAGPCPESPKVVGPARSFFFHPGTLVSILRHCLFCIKYFLSTSLARDQALCIRKAGHVNLQAGPYRGCPCPRNNFCTTTSISGLPQLLRTAYLPLTAPVLFPSAVMGCLVSSWSRAEKKTSFQSTGLGHVAFTPLAHRPFSLAHGPFLLPSALDSLSLSPAPTCQARGATNNETLEIHRDPESERRHTP